MLARGAELCPLERDVQAWGGLRRELRQLNNGPVAAECEDIVIRDEGGLPARVGAPAELEDPLPWIDRCLETLGWLTGPRRARSAAGSRMARTTVGQ